MISASVHRMWPHLMTILFLFQFVFCSVNTQEASRVAPTNKWQLFLCLFLVLLFDNERHLPTSIGAEAADVC